MAQLIILASAIKTDLEMKKEARENFVRAVQHEYQYWNKKRNPATGPSVVRIGRTLGITRHSVTRWLTKYGMTLTCLEVTQEMVQAEVTREPDGQVDATTAL